MKLARKGNSNGERGQTLPLSSLRPAFFFGEFPAKPFRRTHPAEAVPQLRQATSGYRISQVLSQRLTGNRWSVPTYFRCVSEESLTPRIL